MQIQYFIVSHAWRAKNYLLVTFHDVLMLKPTSHIPSLTRMIVGLNRYFSFRRSVQSIPKSILPWLMIIYKTLKRENFVHSSGLKIGNYDFWSGNDGFWSSVVFSKTAQPLLKLSWSCKQPLTQFVLSLMKW